MPTVDDTLPEVGSFELEVFGGGRNGWHTASTFKVRADAIALDGSEILLLSLVGPETSVKAITAALRSAKKDQGRVSYKAQVGAVHCIDLLRCPDGYRVYRTKLAYGLWHVLCLAERDGFLAALTEEAFWQYLQNDRFTTPLLRDWAPWLYRRMKERRLIMELKQSGCQAGLVRADSDALDALVSEGIRGGKLAIAGRTRNRLSHEPAIDKSIINLDSYMLAHGAMLGKQAERSLKPLHVPGRDPLPDLTLSREPFEAQRHVVEAIRHALKRQKSLLLVGEMGTGKTLMGIAAIHAHTHGRPYRALVFCPGQLVQKWEREIRETIPGVEVIQIKNWTTLLHLDRRKKPARPEWYIIPRDRAKLGAKWRPSCRAPKHLADGFLRCPRCGLRLVNEDREPLQIGRPAANGQPGTGLWKRRSKCEWVLTNSRGRNDPDREHSEVLAEGCGSPLWQMHGELQRYEPALFIKRHLRHFFNYLILDEVHEEKGADTAQAHAAGALAAACNKVIALTGTLIGGYAEHLRPLLFRLSARSLVQEGLGWSNLTAFNERYGRIETRITERSGSAGEDNRMSRGSKGSKTTIKSIRPGIMPVLFGKHLIDKAVFLSLNEVADNLPSLEEECIPVRMDRELERAYRQDVEKPLTEAIKAMMRRRDRRLLGAMLQTLLAYPDYPFGWGPIGYWDRGKGGTGAYVTVTTPPNLPDGVVRAKEQALIDLVRSEKEKGRKVWVYVQFSDKHDVQTRLEKLLGGAGFNVKVLHASVPLAKREEWIAQHAPQLDVVVSHPRLVETGLDLFDKSGRHNFPTICFHENGYNLFTLRQASRRSWRIGQREACRIVYFFYEGTMQERAMSLMGRKLTAAQSLEGAFSSEGLVAMAGEDANVEIALARSLVERMDEGDVRRMWGKVVHPAAPLVVPAPANGHAGLELPDPVAPILPFPRPARRLSLQHCAGMLF